MNNTKLSTRHDGNTGLVNQWKDFFDIENIFGRNFLSPSGKNFPAVNVSENDKNYLVEVVAPGFKKEDFKVSCDEDVLTISAEAKEETKNEDKNYSRREYSYSSFTRSFNLPENAKQDISASYKDGVLLLTIPKTEQQKKNSKTIEIK